MLLSACVIAKDESAPLPRCLASLAGLVDEVVVYDTGSTDGTVAVAEGAGARVVRGSWPGSFADARNEAAAHCAGEWVLSVDADEEVLVTDPAAVRSRLPEVPADIDALVVSVDNVVTAGPLWGYADAAERLLRRRRCRWRGRLHERLVGVAGELVPSRHLDDLRVRHHGDPADPRLGRAKAERDVQLALAEVGDPSFGDRGIALVALGRSLWAAGRLEEGLPALLEASRTTRSPSARRQALAGAVRLALALGRTDVAAAAATALRAASSAPVAADVLQAGVHLAAGRHGEALALLDTVTGPVRDDDGCEHSPRSTAEWRAAALLGAGRPGEAADGLLRPLRDDGQLVADLDLLVAALEQAGRSLGELATAAPAQTVATLAAWAARLRPDRSHRVLDVLWRRWAAEDDGRSGSPAQAVLDGAASAARLLPAERAAVWSARLRQAGMVERCPLAALARDRAAPPARRLQAALAAGKAGDEETAALAVPLAALQPPPVLDGAALPDGVRAAASALRAEGIPAPRSWDRRRSVAPCAPAGQAPPAVSVVLTACGAGPRVPRDLQTLTATLSTELACQVVVVLAGADGCGPMRAVSLGDDVVVVEGPLDVGRVAARNLGLAAASAGTVCFVDLAARPERDWLAPLVADLAADPRLGCVGSAWRTAVGDLVIGGAVRAEESSGRAAGLARRPWGGSGLLGPVVDWQLVGERRATGPQLVDVVPGHVVAVRRAAIESLGGFDEGYWNGGEVADLCAGLAADGWTVAGDPASVATGDTGIDLTAALWADQDPAQVAPLVAGGPRWQWRDNRERYTQRWLVPSLVP